MFVCIVYIRTHGQMGSIEVGCMVKLLCSCCYLLPTHCPIIWGFQVCHRLHLDGVNNLVSVIYFGILLFMQGRNVIFHLFLFDIWHTVYDIQTSLHLLHSSKECAALLCFIRIQNYLVSPCMAHFCCCSASLRLPPPMWIQRFHWFDIVRQMFWISKTKMHCDLLSNCQKTS